MAKIFIVTHTLQESPNSLFSGPPADPNKKYMAVYEAESKQVVENHIRRNIQSYKISHIEEVLDYAAIGTRIKLRTPECACENPRIPGCPTHIKMSSAS